MVKFETVFGENVVKASQKVAAKKFDAVYALIVIFCLLSSLISYFESGELLSVIPGIVLAIVLVLISKLILSATVKSQIKSMTLLSEQTKENYTFTYDSLEIVSVRGDEYFCTVRTKYSYLFLVEEHADFYLLYISKNQYHVVDKNGLVEGTLDELNDIFARNLGNKFKPLATK